MAAIFVLLLRYRASDGDVVTKAQPLPAAPVTWTKS